MPFHVEKRDQDYFTMHVLSILLLIVMALVKGMALRGLGATFTAKLTSRLSVAGAIPSITRQYGSSKKAYPSSSSRMRDRSDNRPIPQPKATVIKQPKATPTEPPKAPAPSLTEPRPSPEKSRKGPEILETFPDALLPKDFASWSGTAADFQRLVVLEDDAILVVFKPAGVMAQPDDDEKAAGVDAGFGSLSKVAEPPSRIVVRNNRYFYPDIDILTLATEYLERKAEKVAAGQPKPKQRSKYLDGFDDDHAHKEKAVFVGLIHRLDRPASGLMILAKTPEALKNLNKQFADQIVIKRYVCMVNGKIDQPDVCIDYLLKSSGDVAKVVRNPFRNKPSGSTSNTSTSTSSSNSSTSSSSSSSSSSSGNPSHSESIFSIDDILQGRLEPEQPASSTAAPAEATTANDPRLRSDVVRAELSYTPLHVIEHTVRKKWDNIVEAKNTRPRHPKRPPTTAANIAPETEEVVKVMADGFVETKTYQTLLNVTLLTGRKHQIRTQLSHRQHPIVGDQKYLAPQAFGERDISLHAYYLGFFHPTTRARVALRLDVPRIWEKRFGRDTWKQIVPLVARPVHSKAAKAAEEAGATAAAVGTTTAVETVTTGTATATAAAAPASAPAASGTVA